MFCSNCGKTIRLEDVACQHCGASLGEGRFYGNAYTSCQVRIPAEALSDAPEGGMISYTRTNYMTSGVEASHQQFADDAYEAAGYAPEPAPAFEPQDIHTGTTYRPLLSEEEDLALMEEEEAAAAAEEEARLMEEEAAAQEFAETESEEASQPAGDTAEEPAGEAPAEEEPAAEEDEAEDIPEVSTSPLPPLKKAAISPRVLSYMEELERQQQRRAAGSLRMPSFLSNLNLKKKAAPVPEEELPEAEDVVEADESAYEAAETYEETEAFEESAAYEETEAYEEAEAFEETAAYEETEAFEEPAGDEYAEAEYAEDMADGEGEYAGDDYEDAEQYVSDDDSFDSFEETDGESDEEPQSRFDLSGLLGSLNLKSLLENKIVKMSLAAALIIAVLIGGIVWLNFVTTKRSKVVDVTYSVYTQGIEMIQSHVGEEYRSAMSQVYLTNTGTANQHFSEDMAALNALMPEEPAVNDELFITTLTIIQDNIVDAIKADAEAELNGKSADRAVTSVRDWQAIEDAVAKLASASTPGELSVLAGNLESVTAPTATPIPEPTADPRRTLRNGMMDDMDVKYMQNKLVNLGYLEGTPDGDFGNGTEAAVKAFQRAAGLTADGVVTPAVLDAMEAEDAPRAPGSAAPSDPSAQ